MAAAAHPEEPLLEVRELRVGLAGVRGRAERALVDGVSLRLEAGGSLGLLGESGCGKTLLARSLIQLLPPGVEILGGSIRFAGRELLGLSERELGVLRGGRIGFVFQEPARALNPVLRVGRQVEEGIELHRRLGRAERRQEVLRLLEEAGLEDPERVARAWPHELSGGMQQRVMLAVALAGDPDLLIADEPTTALDVRVQQRLLERVREIQERRGLALLWISHDLAVLGRIARRLAVLYAGRLVEEGPVQQVLEAPAHPYTRGLRAAVPRLDRRELPRPVPGRVPPPEAWLPGCRFADRCSLAAPPCLERPPLAAVPGAGDGHRAACWWVQDPQGFEAAQAGEESRR